MRRPARWAGLALLVAAVLALAAYLYAGRWHPSDRAFPDQGIDVSHHQGAIDWSRLPAQGVDFAYIKASEGGDHRDRNFASNWAGAGRAGIAGSTGTCGGLDPSPSFRRKPEPQDGKGSAGLPEVPAFAGMTSEGRDDEGKA